MYRHVTQGKAALRAHTRSIDPERYINRARVFRDVARLLSLIDVTSETIGGFGRRGVRAPARYRVEPPAGNDPADARCMRMCTVGMDARRVNWLPDL